MAGITSYGAYIPYYRLARTDIARAWQTGAPPGEKAVAGYDEDSLTLAVGAALDCTADFDTVPDALYFASTTSPYREKQAAAVAATVLDLPPSAITMDFAGSQRCATGALRAALDSVRAGSAKNVLVTAAETRLGHPGSEQEMNFGDGAAAVSVGDRDVIAEIEGYVTRSDTVVDVWRRDRDTFVRAWEDRFVIEASVERVVLVAVAQALAECALPPSDIQRVIFTTPLPRAAARLAKKLGFDAKTQLLDTLREPVGDTGAAAPLLTLAGALEDAAPGERIMLVAFGDGCDVFIFRVTAQIKKLKNRRGVKRQIAVRQPVPSYESYLQWRHLLQRQPPARPDPERPAAPALLRDNDGGLALHGSRCLACGTVQYPLQRICVKCGVKDNYEHWPLQRRVGRLFTFCQDNLVFNPNPPTTVITIDYAEGGRFVGDMTDCTEADLEIGAAVEMTFRRISEAGHNYNYWWKGRPLRY